MKAFKKLALVTAIAAAPFAQAEMTAIDDSLLGEMTGQAGISIELDTAITIDTFTYTDTDGKGNGAGNISMTGIAFGGSSLAGNVGGDATLKDLVVKIDVDSTNGIVIQLAGTDTTNGLLGVNPVDFGLHVDGVSGSGITDNIASDINIAGNLGPIDVTINNTSGANLINVEAFFEVTSGSLDVDVIGLGITNLKIGQDSSPLFTGAGTHGYRAEMAAAFEADGTLAGINPALTAANVDDATLIAIVNGAAGSAAAEAWIAANAVDPLAPTPTEQATAQGVADATNAAVNPDNATNMAFVALTVGTGDTIYQNLTEGTVRVSNALVVNLTDFNIDVSMDLSMGATEGAGVDEDFSTKLDNTYAARSMGSIALDNLNMSGTTLKIYGH
jgi:hypothetical protein